MLPYIYLNWQSENMPSLCYVNLKNYDFRFVALLKPVCDIIVVTIATNKMKVIIILWNVSAKGNLIGITQQ